MFIALGLLALATVIWLPVPGEAAKRRQPAGSARAKAPPNYGELVVGPQRPPPDAGDVR